MNEGSGVRFAQLVSDNYYVWKTNMESTLKLKGLWGPVSGTGAWASEADLDKKIVMDQKARAMMVLSISPPLRSLIESKDTPQKAWEELKAVFQAQFLGRRHALRRKLEGMQRSKGEEPLTFVKSYGRGAKRTQRCL
jgi:hypothetical protein